MNKKVLSYLTALFMLFSNGLYAKDVKAQTNVDAKLESGENELSYTLLPIETMFNTKSDRKINTFQRFFLATFNGGELLVPAYSLTYEPIINEEKTDFEGNTVSLSYLKELFGNDSIYMSEYYEIVFEYTNQIPVYITDLNSNLIAINNDYFDSLMNNPLYSELKKIRLFEIYEFLEYFVEDASEREHILNSPNRIPVSEYFETIYKKYVPMKYWPVSIEYQKDNNITNTSNLPKLKEEILNSSFEEYSVLLVFNSSNKYGEYTDPYKVSISRNYRDFEKGIWCKSDLYTDENIRTINNSVPFLNPNEVIEEIYDVNKEANTFIIDELTNPHLVNILEKLIWEATTVREVVELYEQLPAEYQVDYSYFDFTNSPNVEQTDKSSKVVDEKGNFVADLDNMTVRPKVKALNKES